MGERLFCFVTCFLTLGFVSFLKVNDFFWKSFTNLDLVKNMELYGAQNIFGNKHTVAFCDFQKKKVFFICDFKNQARQQKFLPQKLKKKPQKKILSWVATSVCQKKLFGSHTCESNQRWIDFTKFNLAWNSIGTSEAATHWLFFFFNRKVYFNLGKKRRPMLFWELHRSINLWARFFFHRSKFFLFCFDCLRWPETVVHKLL